MLTSFDASHGVTLRGLPHQLLAIVPMPPTGLGWLPVELDVPGPRGATPLMALVAPSGMAEYADLRLTLPGTTPPGRYAGTIRLGERSVGLSVEVQPNANLRVVPEHLLTRAHLGGDVNVEVTVLNPGNVAYDVRPGYVFPLVDANAIDRALSRATGVDVEQGSGRARGTEPTSSSGRADRLVDELAEGRGGPGRVEVHAGVGALPPGEARVLRATLKLPDRLRPGRAYSGAWRLQDAAVSVRVEVADGPDREEASR